MIFLIAFFDWQLRIQLRQQNVCVHMHVCTCMYMRFISHDDVITKINESRKHTQLPTLCACVCECACVLSVLSHNYVITEVNQCLLVLLGKHAQLRDLQLRPKLRQKRVIRCVLSQVTVMMKSNK